MKDKSSFFQDLFDKINTWLSDIEFLKNFLVPIHPAGFPFIVIFSLLSLILGSISDFLGWLGIFLTAWCVYFFRDPVRVSPKNIDSVISPADGKILPIIESFPPSKFGIKEKMKKISIFMNVFNVHVNRIPIAGKILDLIYEPGAFFNASLDKASKDNERMSIRLEIEKGTEIVIVQIAGLIARRIKCDLEENQIVKSGEKFGLIRFGSRLDVYLPLSASVNVLEGQTVIGGETIIANLIKKKIKAKNPSVKL